ncbi:MAG TPA: PP2C family protein-serine/threonine phosphatase, partial [Terracidiphilus sp.]|nr:PP2C family protein-serine/threonine phosphatase [Terracidiphilus sp.]
MGAERAQTKDSGFSPCGLSPRSEHSREFFRSLSKAALVCAVFLFFISTSALPAQSFQTIPPQQCVWRAGDNPAWAAPGLDQSEWQSLAQWPSGFKQGRFWLRCTVDLAPMREFPGAAIQISVPAAYELYLDGRQVGSFGNVSTGNFSMDRTRSWTLPPGLAGTHDRIALRLAYRSHLASGPATLWLGRADELKTLRDSTILSAVRSGAGMAVCYIVVAAIGFALFGFFLSDRSRPELLLLGLVCVSLAILRLIVFAANVQAGISTETADTLFGSFNVILEIGQVLFFFRLARRRIPIIILVPLTLESVWLVFETASSVVPFSISVRMHGALAPVFIVFATLSGLVSVGSALLAFLPLRRLPSGTHLLAALCWLWALTDVVWIGFEIFSKIPGFPDLFARWYSELAEARGIALLAIVVTLVALLLREQRRVFEERAELTGEMHAARNVQQYLISTHLPETPGLAIESEYQPSREVGGDFFQVLPLDDGVLVVVGDVAGKGIEAGMLASLIVGSIRTAAAFTSDPERILALLNERLQGRGLVTCLALRVERNGTATVVNAGHLPPFLNGSEMDVEGSLPLGAAPGIPFPVARFQLAESDTLVL